MELRFDPNMTAAEIEAALNDITPEMREADIVVNFYHPYPPAEKGTLNPAILTLAPYYGRPDAETLVVHGYVNTPGDSD